ncbi:MAG: LD-carboxypeptidase [Bacteroidia bacterium]|nr:LD-carboxypeptidase [Bacteroidia bacterium]MBP9688033.1 LD-carboxypeptidase [Bacteroidia bacterium]
MRYTPPKLVKGDKIAIAASARKISMDELAPAIKIFESWGLEVILHPDLFAVDNQFAGNDAIRANVLNTYLKEDEIKAIIFARGGYGTVRIIDDVDFSGLINKPKWLIGYSDITVIHSHVNVNGSINTLHATMPINMQLHNANYSSIDALRNVLFDENDVGYQIPQNSLNRFGIATAEVVGGNLSVLFSLLGSKSDLDTNGKILFIEDLDEYLYHIDRMMQALKRAGKLNNLAGLIVGGLSDMRDNTVPFGFNAEEIIANTVREYNYPVVFNFPIGHLNVNLPLLIGGTYCLSVDQEIKLNLSRN